MRKLLVAITLCFCCAIGTWAQDVSFETAEQAVANMKIGWNLGNTLDSNTGYTGTDWRYWETIWSQPITTPKIMKLMKNAGFNVIRVPVTWHPHMDADGKVSADWMQRVHEVVDYVINEGMYCLLNVHHDTGATNNAWIIADMDDYAQKKDRFEYLWKQIAEEFKDYDEHLLFEGYNEMLDAYWSWNYASYKTPNHYDEAVARSAYDAVNAYAQSFVNAVRATGGNNLQRNLVCSIYCACEGTGSTWNKHLQDPAREMVLPTDVVDNHLAIEMHYYRELKDMDAVYKNVDQLMANLNSLLANRLGVPVIIGEWGPRNNDGDPYELDHDNLLLYADYLVKKAKENNFVTLYWMGMSNKFARLWPYFNQPDLVETVLKAFYGDDYEPVILTRDDYIYDYTEVTFTDIWGEFYIYQGDALDVSEYVGIRVELEEPPAVENMLQMRGYGNPADISTVSSTKITTDEKEKTLMFNSEVMNGKLTRAVLVNIINGEQVIKVKRAFLIKSDGTEIETELSRRNRCLVTDIVAHLKEPDEPSGISPLPSHLSSKPQWFTLDGRQLYGEPSEKGIYIRHNAQQQGKKVVVR